MADEPKTPKPEDAPDGFWDEFAKWAMSDGNKQGVLDAFMKRNDAPSPEPTDDKPKTEEGPKPKRRGWFASE